jgi:hypothetical protein
MSCGLGVLSESGSFFPLILICWIYSGVRFLERIIWKKGWGCTTCILDEGESDPSLVIDQSALGES